MWLLWAGLSLAEESETSHRGAPEKAPLLQVGLGVGLEGGAIPTYYRSWYGSTSIAMAPVGSLRLVLAGSVILEPDFDRRRSATEWKREDSNAAPDATSVSYVGEYNTWGFGLTVKPLLWRRDGKELYPLVGFARDDYEYLEWRVDDEEREKAEEFILRRMQGVAGLGLQRWFTDDLSLSVDMQVVSLARVFQFDGETLDDDDEILVGQGLTVEPNARLMLHLYW